MRPPPFPTKPVRRGAPPLGARIRPQIAQLAQRSGALDPKLAARWSEVAGPDLARLCRPLRLKRTKNAVTLEVAVTSGAAAMRVEYAQNAILARARTELREPRLTRLAIVQAGAKPKESRTWKSRRVEVPKDEAPAPPPQRPARTPAEALERLRASLTEGRR